MSEQTPQFIVIPGFEKCWTSSFAGYLVESGMCQLLWPQGKEPHLFSRHEFHGVCLTPGLPVLDGSVSYVTNPVALDRLAQAHAKIILLYRNPYDRAFSAFRMYRLFTSSNIQSAEVFATLKENYPTKEPYKNLNWLLDSYELEPLYRESMGEAAFKKLQHFLKPEIERLQTMNFGERLAYEINFSEKLKFFPFYSILLNSLFARATQFVVERFSPERILPVSVHSNIDMKKIAPLLAEFIGVPCPNPINELPNLFNLSNSISFHDSSYKDPAVRKQFGEYFDRDVLALGEILTNHGCDLRLFDTAHLLE